MKSRVALGLVLTACGQHSPPPTVVTGPAPRPPAPVAAVAPAPTAPTAPEIAPTTPEITSPAAVRDDLPPGFVGIGEKTPCGDFVVTAVKDSTTEDYVRFVRLVGVSEQEGAVRFEVHGNEYSLDEHVKLRTDLWAELCGDLTGDGVPELVLTEKTVGAHCCYTHHVVSLTSPPKSLLAWDQGDGGLPVMPVRYRPSGPWQFQGGVVYWPPFDVNKGDPVLSYMSAPVLPAVFTLENGAYVMKSFAFPEAYAAARTERRAECKDGSFGCDNELIEWAESLIVGDWEREKGQMKDAELRRQLERASLATRASLKKELGTAARPRPGGGKPLVWKSP